MNILNKLPLIGSVLAVRDAILLLWSWIYRNIHKAKIFGLLSLTYASVRAAVALFGFLFTKLNQICTLGQSVGADLASEGSVSGSLFDKVNSVFPVAETLAFLSAYFGVCIATTTYMLIRSAYNALPAKAT